MKLFRVMLTSICALLPVIFLTAEALADAPRRSPVPVARPGGTAAVAPPAEVQARPAQTSLSDLGVTAAPSGRTGYMLVDLDTGDILDQANSDSTFLPASVAKAPTAVYALEALGPDHQFHTRLLSNGPVAGGILQGNIYLQGGGDPELDTDKLAELAAGLQSAGIKRVAGGFYVDESLRPLIPAIDPAQPEHAPYNPSIGALNLNFNRVFLAWRRKSEGGYAVSLEARAEDLSTPAASVTHSISPGPSPDGNGIHYRPREDVEHWVLYDGAMGRRGSLWLPVRRPAIYAGAVFREIARQYGVDLPSPKPGPAPKLGAVLASVASRTLTEITADMLKYSTNLTAEALGLAATAKRLGAATTLQASASEMSRWMSGFAPKAAMALNNHSGLSTVSRTSPAQVLEFLGAASGGLPWLMRRINLADPEQKLADGASPQPVEVRAKTGTMYFGRGLAGYMFAGNGRRMAFAIFSTDFDRRGQIDGDTSVARDRSPGGAKWLRKAKKLEQSLLARWAARFGS